MEEHTAVKYLMEIDGQRLEAMVTAIKAMLHENGLTYRQAVAMLEYMKDRLMDVQI